MSPGREESENEDEEDKKSSDHEDDGEDDEKSSDDKDDDGDDEKGDGKDKKGKEDKDGKKKPKKMSKRKKRIFIIAAVIFFLVVLIGGVLYWLHARHYENTDDAFVDGHTSQVSPQVGGRVITLLIDDNQQVKAGQLLAEIDPRDFEVRLAQAEAQKAQSVAQRDLQQANVGQAEANVKVAEADVFQADRDLQRFRNIDQKAITKQQLDNAISASKSAHAKLDANKQAVDAAKAQVEAAEASIKQADTDIKNANLQISYTKIVAPIDGRITRRTIEVGNVVTEGQPLMAVVSNDLWVTANFKETQLTHMRIGQKVRIEVDAFPDVDFTGHVDSFQKGSGAVFSTLPAENATGNYVKVVQRIPVKIVFDNLQQRDKYPLSPGLSVEPRVTVR